MGYRLSDMVGEEREEMGKHAFALYDRAVKHLLKTDPHDPFAAYIVRLVHMSEVHELMFKEENGESVTDEDMDAMAAKHSKPFNYTCCDECDAAMMKVDNCEKCEGKGGPHVIRDYIYEGEYAEIQVACIHCDYVPDMIRGEWG
mgnify:CR=1 FL=1|tara:strand:- start:147 stop:578 length:432 start_codon:yes stop_codon:yes gene_type:complete